MTRPPLSARGEAMKALVAFERRPDVVRIGDAIERSAASGKALSNRDRGLAQELAYGVLRRRRLLDWVLEPLTKRGLPTDLAILTALRLGAYQVLFTTRIPAHAAVHETVSLVHERGRGFVNAVLRKLLGMVGDADQAVAAASTSELALADGRSVRLARELPDPEGDDYWAIREGLPTFLITGWREAYGAETAHEIAVASSATPAVHLRVVTTNVSGGVDELAASLATEGVETEATNHPLLLRWVGGIPPFATDAFQRGQFVAQDPTATRAAEAVGARPGDAVLDLCAAPGTKATLLAEAVGDRGQVFAWDRDPKRRTRIAENARRLGLNARMTVLDSLDAIDRPIDRVLADVPCSNTGVLARRVEVRCRLTAEDIARSAEVQREILAQAIARLRPDSPAARVVYSTCSIEAAENLDVVRPVAERFGSELLHSETTWPQPPDHDGGFVAVLGPAARREPDSRAT